MTWRQVATQAGISYEALRAIRRGDYRPTELTAPRIEDALRWRHGSVQAVLDGGEPTPVAPGSPERPTLLERAQAIQQQLNELVAEAEAEDEYRRRPGA